RRAARSASKTREDDVPEARVGWRGYRRAAWYSDRDQRGCSIPRRDERRGEVARDDRETVAPGVRGAPSRARLFGPGRRTRALSDGPRSGIADRTPLRAGSRDGQVGEPRVRAARVGSAPATRPTPGRRVRQPAQRLDLSARVGRERAPAVDRLPAPG